MLQILRSRVSQECRVGAQAGIFNLLHDLDFLSVKIAYNVRSKSVLLNACNILMQEVPSFQFHKLFMGLLSEGSQANTRRGSILTTDKDHLLNKKAD